MDTPNIFPPDLSNSSFEFIKNQMQIFSNELNKLPIWSHSFTAEKMECLQFQKD